MEVNSPRHLMALRGFQAVEMPPGISDIYRQVVLRGPDPGFDTYTAYLHPAQAMAEVVYSRLALALGLPCVTALYAPGADIREDVPYISVSNYSPNWLSYLEWRDNTELISLTNSKDIARHGVLSFLLHKQLSLSSSIGYILSDQRFIKANNGGTFFSLGLRCLLEGKELPDASETFSVSYFLDNTIEYEEGYGVLKRVSSLSPQDMQEIVYLPPGYEEYNSYFINILKNAKFTADRCFEAIAE